MRNLFSKLMTGGLIVGAALAVSACGHKDTATTETNMSMDNSAESDMGSMNDVTAVDGAMGASGNMAMDNGAMSDNMSSGMSDNGSAMSDNMSNGM